MAVTIEDIYKDIDGYENTYITRLSRIEKDIFKSVESLLRELSVDNGGRIKRTSANMKVLNKIKKEFNTLPKNQSYQKLVSSFDAQLKTVVENQYNFLNEAIEDEFQPNAFMKSLVKDSFENVKESMIGSGVKSNFVNGAINMVFDGITGGEDYFDLNERLKKFIVSDKNSDSKLASYSKQIINDTLMNTSREINNAVTGVSFEWYKYVGSTKDTTRPFCEALIKKKFIHRSEFAKICRGEIDGQKVSLEGLYPGTNQFNLISNCGGYNCSHQLIGVGEKIVPAEIRNSTNK